MRSRASLITSRPMICICACLNLGLASVSFLSFLNFSIIVTLFALIFICIWFRYKSANILFILLLLSFIITGRFLIESALKESPSILKAINLSKKSPLICEGLLANDPIQKEKGISFIMDLSSCAVSINGPQKQVKGRIRLFAPSLPYALQTGDYIRFRGRIYKPTRFKNPGSFDYNLYLATQRIDALGSVAGPSWILKIGHQKISLPKNFVRKIRNKIDYYINKSSRGDAAAILKTISIGKRDELSRDLREVFLRTGTAHLLAISGLHVGFLALIVFLIVKLFLGWWPRLVLFVPQPLFAAAVGIPAIWLYIAVADFPVSAIRAGIMLTVFIVAFLSLRLKNDLISALALAVFIILLVSPLSIFAASFQLSVAAVFSIITLAPVLIKQVKTTRWPFAHLIKLAAVTMAATIATAPLVAYHFHYFTAAGLIANIVCVPLLGLVLLPLTLLAVVTTLIWPQLGEVGLKFAVHSANYFLNVIYFFDQILGRFHFDLIPSFLEVVCFIFFASAVILFKYLPYRRLAPVILSILFIFFISYSYARPVMETDLKVLFIDVGQGDAIAIRFPNGRVGLIDGGGIKASDFDIGENIVVPALLGSGIRRVDFMILSHPHHDHYKGLGAVAKYFEPDLLYTNGGNAPEEERADWDEFKRRIKESGVRIITPPPNQIKEGDVIMEIFAPRPKDVKILDPNDASLMVRLMYGEHRFLFTGDLTEIGERMWLENKPNLKSDILKIGHHGSNTSTTADFLNAVNPSLAVITTGENNKYGFPDREVIDRLKSKGIRIHRTDLDGAVTITTDGNSLFVDTFVKGK